MRDPWQWEEQDIQVLIHEQRKEDLQLEYKRSDALAKTDARKAEISKDVSAMANSAGGVIVYGIDEQKNGVIQLDSGIDPNEVSIEWLEQVIDSGIRRKIDGIKIRPVRMTVAARQLYVVCVPQSNRAPHMAADHRYHKRLGTTTTQIEEYEVRDVGRRLESPDLYLDLKVRDPSPGIVALEPRIGNLSAEPAFYAMCRLYIDHALTAFLRPNMGCSKLDDTELFWNNRDVVTFQVFRYPWSVPERHPILEGEQYQMHQIDVGVGVDFRNSPQVFRYNVGWELRASRAAAKIQGLKLTVDHTGPRIEHTYSLARR